MKQVKKQKQKKQRIPTNKEPSLLRKLITIYYEQAIRRRTIRKLQNQSWSFDYLALLVVKASKFANSALSLTLTDKDGKSFTITCNDAMNSDVVNNYDDSILDHLDSDVAIDDFIRRNSRR